MIDEDGNQAQVTSGRETPCVRCGKPTFYPPTCDTCDRWTESEDK